MNHGYGIFDPNKDDEIDRGRFCHSNGVENSILAKIDRDRKREREKNNPSAATTEEAHGQPTTNKG